MPRKAVRKTKKQRSVPQRQQSFASYDSYKSLLYGIATVIILFIIGFGVVKLFVNRPKPEIDSQAVSIQNIIPATPTPGMATQAAQMQEDTPTPTVVIATPKPTTIANTPTPQVAANPGQKTNTPKDTHVVKPGESLWDIAVVEYKDGYKWTEIAKANNITNPSTIFKDDRLIIPAEEVTPTPLVASDTGRTMSNGTVVDNAASSPQKISGSTYVVQRGDDLWNIAVRAYNDGYKWTEIAKANNLTDPSLIFSGNTLKIPR